jgi:hypothetical protein
MAPPQASEAVVLRCLLALGVDEDVDVGQLHRLPAPCEAIHIVGLEQRRGPVDVVSRETPALAEGDELEAVLPSRRRGCRRSKRIACSTSRLTDVPDSAARFFSCARSRSSSVTVVRMMRDHTRPASAHQATVALNESAANRHRAGRAHAAGRAGRFSYTMRPPTIV